MNNKTAARLAAFRVYAREEEDEERRQGVSTKIKLEPYDPWIIQKTLFKSDIDASARLLLGKASIEKHVIPYLGSSCDQDFVKGQKVKVFDIDTWSVHQLVLKKWSTNSFVLTSNWVKEFVRRRALQRGDQIGLFWDPWNARLCFHLLRKAAAPPN